MINLVVAYDDNAAELADYFEMSYNYLYGHISKNEIISCYPINGLNCSELTINSTIDGFGNGKFGFVGFSHGNSEELLTDNEIYVCRNNKNSFKESFFYSTACELAGTLGQELIDAGCSCFIGYWEISLATYEEFYDVYIDCETYALKEFLNNDKTFGEAFDEMLDYFDSTIEDLFSKNQVLVAMELAHNKQYFNIKGDENLKISDFNYNSLY